MVIEKETKNRRKRQCPTVALIWHRCPYVLQLVQKNGWTLIDGEEAFNQTDFDFFDQIILLAETKWDGFFRADMTGLKLAYTLCQHNPQLIKKMVLISRFSKAFFRKRFETSYHKSIASTRMMLSWETFEKCLTPNGLVPGLEQEIEAAYESLWSLLIYFHSYDASLPELVSQVKRKLLIAATQNLIFFDPNFFKVLIEKLIPQLVKIKYASERILSTRVPHANAPYFLRVTYELARKWKSLFPHINDLLLNYHALMQQLQHSEITNSSARQLCRMIDQDLSQLADPFSNIETFCKKIRVQVQMLS